VLLQKETFYRLNRIILLTCLSFSFIFPLIPVPKQFSLRTGLKVISSGNEAILSAEELSMPNQSTIAIEETKKPAAQVITYESSFKDQIIQWGLWIYWFGVAAFGANLLLQVSVLLYQSYRRPVIKDGIYRIIELETNKAPCSFGNSIFINPTKYDWETYNQILMHEKVHIRQGHTFDLIVAEFMLVFQWFNPFAWLYRKELESNLEFLTDDSVLNHNTIEPADYQLSLLKVSVPNFSLSIVTNYNQSLLKKRIVMMNAKKSNLHTMWKYFMLMPLFVLIISGLNKTVAVSGTTKSKGKTSLDNFYNDSTVLTKLKGSWYASIKNNKIKIEFKIESEKENHTWSSNTFNLSEFPILPRNSRSDFSLNREAGTLIFNGRFDGVQGYGNYQFIIDKNYLSFIEKQGISNIKADDYISFFMADVKKSYIKFLKNTGFKDINKDQIIAMANLNVEADYINYWRKIGYENLDLDQLIALKILKIDTSYINKIRESGYKNLTINEMVNFQNPSRANRFNNPQGSVNGSGNVRWKSDSNKSNNLSRPGTVNGKTSNGNIHSKVSLEDTLKPGSINR